MAAVALAEPQVLRATSGRIRVHMPGWSGQGCRRLEDSLRQAKGVVNAQASGVTANILICFDPGATTRSKVLAALVSLLKKGLSDDPPLRARPHVQHERTEHTGRARIAVPGLDRNPEMVRRVVDHYSALPGVKHVSASVLTGRILVEYSSHELDVEDLLDHLTNLELADVEGEDAPAYPLDPAPLVQSSVRAAGASAGLLLLGLSRATGYVAPAGLDAAAARSAAAMGILQGFPFVRNGLRRLLGPATADLALYLPSVALLTLSGSPLGLTLAAGESFRILTEVLPRRAAWRRYEAGLESAAEAHPGDVIRLESGESDSAARHRSRRLRYRCRTRQLTHPCRAGVPYTGGRSLPRGTLCAFS